MTRKHKKKDKDTHMQAALCRPAQRGWMSSLCLKARVELPFAVVSCGALFRLLAAKIVYAYVMYMCMYVMCVLLYRFAGVRVYSICSARRGA